MPVLIWRYLFELTRSVLYSTPNNSMADCGFLYRIIWLRNANLSVIVKDLSMQRIKTYRRLVGFCKSIKWRDQIKLSILNTNLPKTRKKLAQQFLSIVGLQLSRMDDCAFHRCKSFWNMTKLKVLYFAARICTEQHQIYIQMW